MNECNNEKSPYYLDEMRFLENVFQTHESSKIKPKIVELGRTTERGIFRWMKLGKRGSLPII